MMLNNFTKIIFLFIINSIYSQSETLDTTFGNNGLATTEVSTQDDDFHAIIKINNNKILAGGKSDWHATIICYNLDGSINTNYGSNGILQLNFGGTREMIYDMEIQSDNKIIILAQTKNTNNNYDIIVARINQDGSYDNSFGTNGISTITFGNDNQQAFAIKIQNDGKIIGVGKTTNVSFDKMAIFRLNTNGTLDNTFNNDGKQTVTLSPRNNYFTDIDITSNGKIIATGTVILDSGSSQSRTAIVRFLNDGDIDVSFGNNGSKIINILDGYCSAHSLISLPDNKTLIAGQATGISIGQSFSITKFDINGNLDPSFGNNGSVITTISNGISNIYKIKINQNNQIYAVGKTSNNNGESENFAMAKYLENGQLDTTFGNSGIVITDFTNSYDRAWDFILTDNSITLAGSSMQNYPKTNFALAQYEIQDNLNATQLHFSSHFKVYSMITNKNLIIEANSRESISKITVVNIYGKIVYKKQFSNSFYEVLNLNQLNKGFYFLKINNYLKSHKVILN